MQTGADFGPSVPGPACESRIFLPVLLACMLALAGCGGDRQPLRIGLLAWPPYDLAYLAVDRELAESDYDLVGFQSPSEVVRSFRYGLIDAMFVTSHFALTTLDELEDLRIIYVIDVSLGGDALLARKGIETAEDLVGARIGVEAAPLGVYTLVRALGELGLSREDVEVVNIDTPEHLEAWQAGEIDALVTYEPMRTVMKRDGAVELFNSESIPFEIVDVLVVRERVIRERRSALVRFVRGLDEALTHYRNNVEATSDALSRRHALTAPEFRQAMNSVEMFGLEQNLAMLTDDQHPLFDALTRQCEVMRDAGMLVTIPDLDPLIHPGIVERASRR